MSTAMILAPLFVQVLLTFAVMFGMMVFRTRTLQSGETRFQDIAMREPNWPRRPAQFANSFSNQFELPVLFYAALLCAAALGILLGGLGSMAPSRRKDIASLGMRAILAATLANLMSATIAGIMLG